MIRDGPQWSSFRLYPRKVKVTRDQIEQARGTTMPDWMWESFCTEAAENYEWLGREMTLEQALGLLRGDPLGSKRRRATTTRSLERRGEALGAWALRGIRNSVKVRFWRQRHGLMAMDALHRAILSVIDASDGLPAHEEALEWIQGTAEGDVEWWREIPAGSWLAELADCAAEVAAEYRMRRCEATVAVACDVAGFVEPVLTWAELRSQFGDTWTPAGPLSRIVLEVDPMTPPEVVASAYREARADWLPGPRRIMGDRMLRLAAFMAGETRVIDGPRSRWGYERPFVEMERDWRMASGDGPNPNFARDAREAVRLIHQG